MKIIQGTREILPYRDVNLGKFSLCNNLLGFIGCCVSTEDLGYDESLAYTEHREEILGWSFESWESLFNVYQFLVILRVFFYKSITTLLSLFRSLSTCS